MTIHLKSENALSTENDRILQTSKNLNVLYVEDSLTVRKVTHKILVQYFNTVDLAVNGKEGFEAYRDYHEKHDSYYDIVFTDLDMPQMDGKELSKLILEFNHHQEIVVISAISDSRELMALINIGIKKFLAKPVDNDQVYDVVSQLVASIQKRKRVELEKLEVLEHNDYLMQKQEEAQQLIEAKATELEEFTTAITKSTPIVKTDLKGRVTYVNHLFCRVCGYEEEELIGQNMSILKSGNRSRSFYKKLWNTINDKRSYKTIFENRHKDGSLFFMETTINPILDTNDEIVEFVGVSHDLTQVMKSVEIAQKAEKSKDDFFINISHEMKTPLNSILGFGALLKKRLKNDEKSLMMMETILSTGDDLKNLVESIVDMRKLQDGSLELVEKSFKPKEDFERFFEKFLLKASDKNIELKFNYEQNLPSTLVGDSVRISQLVSFFIDNAIKFTPESGKVHVTIYYDTYEQRLKFEVKDNGIGISEEDKQHIFRIGQVEGDRNRSYEGAGIGLNIAHKLSQTMKGNISVVSKLGRGSLFTIEIPLSN